MQSYPSLPESNERSLPTLEQAKALFLGSYHRIDAQKYLSEVYSDDENMEDTVGYLAGILYLHDLFNDATLSKHDRAKDRFNFYYNLDKEELKHYLDRWQSKRKEQANLQRRNSLVTTPKRKKRIF